MQVKIIVPGKYGNADLKAVKCQKDAILEVKPWYGKELIAEGKAVAVDPVETVEKPKKTAKKKPKKPSPKTNNPGAAFLE
jgi:hypothetical protein